MKRDQAPNLDSMKIAVLLGGHSAEREVSLRSGQAVTEGLQRAGLNAEAVDTAKTPISELPRRGFDVAFIAVHGRGGEDGRLQAVLEHYAIPYTGSGILGCALSMDKIRTKYVWQGVDMPVAKHRVVTEDQYEAGQADALFDSFDQAAIVKPISHMLSTDPGLHIGDGFIINTQHRQAIEGQVMQEFHIGILHARKITFVGFHVIRFNIGHDADHRLQMQERGVAFVCFGNQIATGTQLGIGARAVQQAPDNECWIQSRLGKNTGNQTGGGGFAMGTGYGDAMAETH